MPENPIPLKPRSLLTLIHEKLDNLGLDTKEPDLNVIRELLSVQQEDRVLSQKEVEEWRESERKILENQSNYKNDTENKVKKGMCSFWFCLFFTLPISFCIYKAYSLEDRFYLELLFCWPIHFVAILIHCLHLYISTRRVSKPVQVLESGNEDWKGSMTSAKLQSRQKVLVDEWTQLVKERVKNPSLVILRIPQFINWFYFLIRFTFVWHVLFKKPDTSALFLLHEQSAGLLSVEFCFALLFSAFFLSQLGIKLKIEFETN